VKAALVETGRAFGLRRIGSLAYVSTVIETGWWAVPFSANYTSPELRAYREWLSPNHAAMRMSLGGSFYSPKVEDYYQAPWDIGLGHLVKFDHDFVGRAAQRRWPAGRTGARSRWCGTQTTCSPPTGGCWRAVRPLCTSSCPSRPPRACTTTRC
jgi:glycine cleavage system aminomethyltransferase T